MRHSTTKTSRITDRILVAIETESATLISAELSIIATNRLRRAGHTHPPGHPPQAAPQDAGQGAAQGAGSGAGEAVRR